LPAGCFPAAGGRADGLWTTTGADGTTGEVVEVEDVELGGACVDVDGGGGGDGGHDSVTDTTPNRTGNETADNGVPAGTDNDNTCPPNNVTDTKHESAEAAGNAATPTAASASAPARQPRHIALPPIVPKSYGRPARGATLPTE
jgi:hypothetical protein